MALKQIKHWSWGLLRSVVTGVGEGTAVTFTVAGVHGMGIDVPTIGLKAFFILLGLSAYRSFAKYLKDNPIPDIDEETK